jgi:hypothetical protein
MSSPLPFDPTKKHTDFPRRDLGQIVIQWDPNTGRLGFNSQGLTPIEEVGVTQWFLSLRMKQFLKDNDNEQVVLAPPGSKLVTQ